jgi:hypothetical protein
MKLTRRAFFEGIACAVATVAIATRMAPRFLPDSLRGGTWKYEQATEKYFYGIDTAKPWDVHLFEQSDFHEPESWKLMDPSELMKRAFETLVKTDREVQVGPHPRDKDRSFVCGNDERWPWNNSIYITHQTIEEVGVRGGAEEAMEACSIIAMSQGFAALQVEGHGPIFPDKTSPYMEEMEVDVFAVPTIHTTKEDLFRHA